MSPTDASVYSDTMSPLTWVLLLAGVITFVLAISVLFLTMVHRSIEKNTARPKIAHDVPGEPLAFVTRGQAPAIETGHGSSTAA